MTDSPVDLVRRFARVLVDRDLSALDQLLTRDCVDHDALPGLPGGAGGVKLKLALYLAQHADARSDLERVVELPDRRVEAYWTTTFASGEASRFCGMFSIEARRIAAFRVDRVG